MHQNVAKNIRFRKLMRFDIVMIQNHKLQSTSKSFYTFKIKQVKQTQIKRTLKATIAKRKRS